MRRCCGEGRRPFPAPGPLGIEVGPEDPKTRSTLSAHCRWERRALWVVERSAGPHQGPVSWSVSSSRPSSSTLYASRLRSARCRWRHLGLARLAALVEVSRCLSQRPYRALAPARPPVEGACRTSGLAIAVAGDVDPGRRVEADTAKLARFMPWRGRARAYPT